MRRHKAQARSLTLLDPPRAARATPGQGSAPGPWPTSIAAAPDDLLGGIARVASNNHSKFDLSPLLQHYPPAEKRVGVVLDGRAANYAATSNSAGSNGGLPADQSAVTPDSAGVARKTQGWLGQCRLARHGSGRTLQMIVGSCTWATVTWQQFL